MATIGNWGEDIIFSTSDSRVLTFRDFSRTVSSSWANHSRVGLKDRSEFVRPGLQKIKFTMDLNALLGVKPRAALESLEAAVESGVVNTLVIGGKAVGSNRWKITETGEAWNVIYTEGELVKAKVDVTMEEYL